MRKLAALVVLALAAFASTEGTALIRDRSALPDAAATVRAATVEAASIISCVGGVQDDLFVDTSGDTNAASVVAARDRLSGCDLARLRTLVGSLHLPSGPPIETARLRGVRGRLEQAQAILRRVMLDAKATTDAERADLRDRRHGAAVVLGFRALQTEENLASNLSSVADALLHISPA